jgi:hypothetical protein
MNSDYVIPSTTKKSDYFPMQHRLVFVIGTERCCTMQSKFLNITYIQFSIHGVNLTISTVTVSQ